MKTGDRGLALIKYFEGLQTRAYLCPAGVWTIGYGHTKGVSSTEAITPEQADALLAEDLSESERAVGHSVTVALSQEQFDALVSFTFNLGAGNLQGSTLLKKLNAGDSAGAADEFLRWVNAGGKKLPGLVERRNAERQLFLSGTP